MNSSYFWPLLGRERSLPALDDLGQFNVAIDIYKDSSFSELNVGCDETGSDVPCFKYAGVKLNFEPEFGTKNSFFFMSNKLS